MAKGLGRIEKPRRHVQRVADIGDLVAHVADFAGDDLAVVERGAERRHGAEAVEVALPVRLHEVPRNERTGEAIAVAEGARARPGQDRLVTHVFVDFGIALQGCVGNVAKEVVQQLVEAHRPQPLGHARRILHVDQQESALFAPGLHVAAGQQVPERAESQQPAHLKGHVGRHRHDHGEDDRGAESRVDTEGIVRDRRGNDAAEKQAANDHHEIEDHLDAEVDDQRQTPQSTQESNSLIVELKERDRRRNDQRRHDADERRHHRDSIRQPDRVAEIGADHRAGQTEPKEDPPIPAGAPRQAHVDRRDRARMKVA